MSSGLDVISITCAASPEQYALRAAATSITDWNDVVRTARKHAVLPLFARALTAHAADVVPPDVLDTLEAEARKNATRSLFLAGVLGQLMTALGSAGIEAIALKGPVVAALAYGDIRLRQFADLDVLVRPEDVTRAAEVLRELGFAPHHTLSAAQERVVRRWGAELAFARDGQLYVDLHWRLYPSTLVLPLTVDDVFRARVRATIAGRELHVLSPAHALLHLCAHGTKSAWRRMAWVCDVDRTVRAGGVAWDEVLAQAARSHNTRMVAASLFLAREHLGTPLPEDVTAILSRDRKALHIARTLAARMFAPRPSANTDLVRLYLGTRERLRDRAAFLVRSVLQPTVDDVLVADVPSPLYVPLRIARMSLRTLTPSSRPVR